MDRDELISIIHGILDVNFQFVHRFPDEKLGGIWFKKNYGPHLREFILFLHYSNGPEMFDRMDMNYMSEALKKWFSKVKEFYVPELNEFYFGPAGESSREKRETFLQDTLELKDKLYETIRRSKEAEKHFSRSEDREYLEHLISLFGEYINKLESIEVKVNEISEKLQGKK